MNIKETWINILEINGLSDYHSHLILIKQLRKIYEKQILFVFDQEFVKIGISSFSALFTNV